MQPEETFKAYYNSPIGIIEVAGTDNYISTISFAETGISMNNDHPLVIQKCVRQIDEYFKGIRKEFSIEFQIKGTDFQKKVWSELENINFGKTISYIELAKRLKDPLAIRAVGTANGKNPLCIVFPCHRVIGSNGNLIGYAGGLRRKQWLLDHERKCVGNNQLSLFEMNY